jgi:hypothetical protein
MATGAFRRIAVATEEVILMTLDAMSVAGW